MTTFAVIGWLCAFAFLFASLIYHRRWRIAETTLDTFEKLDNASGAFLTQMANIEQALGTVKQRVEGNYFHTIQIKAHPGQCFGIVEKKDGAITLATWRLVEQCPVDREALTGRNMIIQGCTMYVVEPDSPVETTTEQQPQTAE